MNIQTIINRTALSAELVRGYVIVLLLDGILWKQDGNLYVDMFAARKAKMSLGKRMVILALNEPFNVEKMLDLCERRYLMMGAKQHTINWAKEQILLGNV
jgi:hypothetical protein